MLGDHLRGQGRGRLAIGDVDDVLGEPVTGVRERGRLLQPVGVQVDPRNAGPLRQELKRDLPRNAVAGSGHREYLAVDVHRCPPERYPPAGAGCVLPVSRGNGARSPSLCRML